MSDQETNNKPVDLQAQMAIIGDIKAQAERYIGELEIDPSDNASLNFLLSHTFYGVQSAVPDPRKRESMYESAAKVVATDTETQYLREYLQAVGIGVVQASMFGSNKTLLLDEMIVLPRPILKVLFTEREGKMEEISERAKHSLITSIIMLLRGELPLSLQRDSNNENIAYADTKLKGVLLRYTFNPESKETSRDIVIQRPTN